MQIDCETISDPQPRLETSETAVIAIQGTQACGDEVHKISRQGATRW